ncbi:uncharacterized protein LOC126024274 [Suncus etruscus]|uniref:uncharacterized protein LOC126024274 n=1 Tax=Suncus etruscus TaxID=109475 RepID=UPI002110E55C|nr:uncharacterized protein LOC126024274 [Suncus etruscus]
MQTNLGRRPLNLLQLAVRSEPAAPYKEDRSASSTVPSCQKWVPAWKEQRGTPTPASPGTGTEPPPVLSAMGAPRPAVRLPVLLLLLVACTWARECGAREGFGGQSTPGLGGFKLLQTKSPGLGQPGPGAEGEWGHHSGDKAVPYWGYRGSTGCLPSCKRKAPCADLVRGRKLGEIGKFGNWGKFGRELKEIAFSFLTEEVLGNVSPSCPKDTTRFKHLRKYVYTYEAEGSSEFPGTADSRSTTKINCKVELEVPQLCNFILKISQCTLEEAYGFDLDGKTLLKKTKNSEEFAAAMSKYELRLTVREGKQAVLYPEKDEPKHILNIKRGIISSLLVPMETEEDTHVLFLVRTWYTDKNSPRTIPSP